MRGGQDLKESLIHLIVSQIRKLVLKEEKGIVGLEVAANGSVGTELTEPQRLLRWSAACPLPEDRTPLPQGRDIGRFLALQ